MLFNRALICSDFLTWVFQGNPAVRHDGIHTHAASQTLFRIRAAISALSCGRKRPQCCDII